VRPVFFNLFKVHLPLAGLVSIKHRLSGVFFFLMFPLWVYIYSLLPLATELNDFCSKLLVQIALWLTINALIYHMIAGFRHLFFDFSSYHSRRLATTSAALTFFISTIFMIWSAHLIWSLSWVWV
jgi:succinate dehydrogenase / fumarate reductase cytochrome b subunit